MEGRGPWIRLLEDLPRLLRHELCARSDSVTICFSSKTFCKFGAPTQRRVVSPRAATPFAGMTTSAPPEPGCLRVELASFGFSHKAPNGVDPDSIFDVRALPNPKTYATELEPRMSRPTHSRKPAAHTCER